jgi:hypothetical protein
VEITESEAADPIRNIRLVGSTFLATHQAQPFHPLYTERLEPFRNLRFMDWGRTNASPLTTWAQRTTPQSNTQARDQGAALELMIALSNQLGQEPWICIPHAADDDFVRQAARLIRDTLDPSLRVWVEYSNETWNTAGPFSQTVYVQDEGEALALDPNRYTAGQMFAAMRSARIWAIFEEEFGADYASRVHPVLATQGGNTFVTETRFRALNDPALNPGRHMPRALAIAPYFGTVFTPDMIAEDGHPTVDDLLNIDAPNYINFDARDQVSAHLAIANEQGCELVCYEGGQHYVGIFGAENDDALTAVLHAANRDPRMHGLYLDYLDMLMEEGVTLFSNFSYVGTHGKFGSWGVLETQDQDNATAHKYRALLDWIDGSPLTGWIVGMPAAGNSRHREWIATFNHDVTGQFSDANLASTGSLAGGVDLTWRVEGSKVRLVAAPVAENSSGTVGVGIDGPLSGAAGGPLAGPITGAAATVAFHPAGDANRDGVTDLVDVLLLGNAVVGAATLP